jgi:hypothetical protein
VYTVIQAQPHNQQPQQIWGAEHKEDSSSDPEEAAVGADIADGAGDPMASHVAEEDVVDDLAAPAKASGMADRPPEKVSLRGPPTGNDVSSRTTCRCVGAAGVGRVDHIDLEGNLARCLEHEDWST